MRVAKAFLQTPRYDTYDLAREVHVQQSIVDNLVVRMTTEGWLTTDDGWNFDLTPEGQRALITVLTQARAFNDKRQGRAS